MKTAIAILILSCAMFAQEVSAPNGVVVSGNATANNVTVNNGDVGKAITTSPPVKTAIQEKAEFDKQVADEKAAAAKAEADKKAAVQKLDNKDPKPIKKAEDRERIAALFVDALLAQKQFSEATQQAMAFLAAPRGQLNASLKSLNDAIAEFQKSHHAEGCDLTPPKVGGDGLKWDCSKAQASAKP